MEARALRIGELAAQAGVNLQTIRYYERRGLLADPARSASGQRQYPPDAARMIRFIRRAQDLGFTLKEIGELVALRGRGGRSRPQVQRLATAKIEDVDRKLARLRALRSALGVLVKSCACGGAEPECPILEALEDESAKPGRGNRGKS